ncbi:integrase family protein [Pseudacidovorax sp. RU35E]|uniref:tyrosine-type recombinase/integrase n=1 Tax=Pseudacidovorax sp. RU35E TaxID=1907403 RepID=UPI0009567475|nr:integrase family protein [Pseudacidovorax sp. RU35E]SIR01046.1 Phage integrase family protein [Pseudacidovorax sp. RU35E]
MPFDAREAKLLQPGQTIIVPESPGLRLAASTSRRSWVYRYKAADGRMRQLTIGQWPAMTLAKAQALWEDLRAGRKGGVDPVDAKKAARAAAAAPKRRAAGYPVRQLVQDYLGGHIDVHRKPKGRAEVRRLLEGYLGAIDDHQAATLKRADAFSLLEGLAKTPVLAGQIRQELGAAWDYALDAGRLPEETPNWWRLIMRGRLRSKGKLVQGERITAKRVLSDVELGLLLRWLPNFTSLIDDGLTLYLWTGARGAEIVAMEAREISEENDGLWWTVPKAKTKTSRIEHATDLRVPLVGRAEAVVRRRLANTPSGYLFPKRPPAEGPVDQKVMGVAVWYHMPYSKTRPDVLRPRLPVEHWAPHDLRRTVRTQLAAMGCPDAVAEAVLGHLPPGIQGVYNRHSYDVERRIWLEKWSARLEELAQQ